MERWTAASFGYRTGIVSARRTHRLKTTAAATTTIGQIEVASRSPWPVVAGARKAAWIRWRGGANTASCSHALGRIVPREVHDPTGCVSVSFIRLASIVIPGPIVDATVRLFTYLPLAALGLARSSSSTTAR